MVDRPPSPEPTPDAPQENPRTRFALAHDWLCGYRGGEAVLERIAALTQDMGEVDRLYTMFDDGRPLAQVTDSLPHCTSPLNRLPGNLRRWLLPFYPLAVRSLSNQLHTRHTQHPVDLIVSTSSAAIKGLKPPAGIPHLCYCHAPARYVWSVRDEYSGGTGLTDRLRSVGLSVFSGMFKAWDRRTAAHVTTFLANSTHTAAEIRRCFDRDATVVFPPVRTEYFTPDPGVTREDFWLFAGALEPYKRADLAAQAATLAGAKLVVVGTGSMEAKLREQHASDTITFLGRVSDDTLRDLYRRARLLVFPQVEDFGITAVEAQACGCPVIARNIGGALDTVIPGETGVLFESPEPGPLAEAAASCQTTDAACRRNAERFSEAQFDRAMRAQLEAALSVRPLRPTAAPQA